MTLISLTLNNGFPILTGDILVTSKVIGQSNSVITPTALLGVGDFLADIPNKPYSLYQKIYVINPCLCIGLAGNLAQMTSYLKSMRAFFSNGSTEKELKEWLNSYDKEKLENLGAIGLHFEPHEGRMGALKVFKFTHGNVKEARTSEFGQTFSIGSGADQFINLAITSTNSHAMNEVEMPDSQKMWRMSLQRNLQLFGRILGTEAFHMTTISNAWGAGLEVIAFKNGAFFKLPETTVSIFEVLFNWKTKKVEGFCSVATMKFYYHNAAFIIDSANNEIARRFIVPELGKESEDYDVSGLPPRTDFNSLNTIVTYYIPREDGIGHYVGQAVLLRDTMKLEGSFIRFIKKEDGRQILDIDSSFRLSIEKKLRNKIWPK